MKQRSLFVRVGFAASAALLALFAAAAPASANNCENTGGWRDGDKVTIRANVADVSDGWKVTARRYTARRLDSTDTNTENSKSEILTLGTDDQTLWGSKALLMSDHHHPMVNLFKTTFQAADGTSVACSVRLQGRGNSYESEYKFISASCSGPDSNKAYVTCQRQYRAGIEKFRVYLTLEDLE